MGLSRSATAARRIRVPSRTRPTSGAWRICRDPGRMDSKLISSNGSYSSSGPLGSEREPGWPLVFRTRMAARWIRLWNRSIQTLLEQEAATQMHHVNGCFEFRISVEAAGGCESLHRPMNMVYSNTQQWHHTDFVPFSHLWLKSVPLVWM